MTCHSGSLLEEARGYGLSDVQPGAAYHGASELNMVTITARYILEKKTGLADQLSYPDQVLPRVFDSFCKVYSRPHINLFATRANVKLPLYVLWVPELMA